jgi:hypothetical protein
MGSTYLIAALGEWLLLADSVENSRLGLAVRALL